MADSEIHITPEDWMARFMMVGTTAAQDFRELAALLEDGFALSHLVPPLDLPAAVSEALAELGLAEPAHTVHHDLALTALKIVIQSAAQRHRRARGDAPRRVPGLRRICGARTGSPRRTRGVTPASPSWIAPSYWARFGLRKAR